ncbi:GMC family oxidoreductase [Labrys wisconsinensis]|uniref:Choline dehydrogenase-like flavoprotein n=1 Tax=Labrys wisconsinensis TaxID=425677 RepID=A0ABU0IYG9_9HYPH|nr:GMC family oxidoreductase [Labrys wisconsinensis]MDQ0467061.1 choline dehydrogenase-like flavoprotein [Labrys wisconsinensis]
MTDAIACDVLIVGSGPAGAVFAQRAVEAGLSVVCLEQGEWVDYDKARSDKPEFELTAPRDWQYVPTKRSNPGDFPIAVEDSDIVPLYWNGVGGSSISWAANWMRNLPSDFRVRTLDGVADDWPISYADLMPHYARTEREFGVSGVAGDPMYPGQDELMPPVDLTEAGRTVAAAHNRLGWHWWPGTNAIATVPRGPFQPCQQRTACMWGCIERAKASTDRSHWPALIRGGARLVTGARVLRLELDAAGLVRGAVYADRATGAEHLARGGVTVLAGNAIGTARILLNSRGAGHDDGLANGSGLVGKRLMLHPTAAVVGLFDRPLESFRGAWGQVAYTLQFYETHPDRDFVRGSKWSLQPTGSPAQIARRWPWGEENELWGEAFHDEFARRFGRSVSWGIICEDLPDEANRVELDPGASDDTGMPGVRIHYRTGENSKRMLRFMAARAQDSLIEAGAYRTVVAPQSRESGWHILGTARMGTDPAGSVVDRTGRCHEVANLFIVDGSVWPTSAGVNPTATIAAFSSWSAAHLVAGRSSQRSAA